MMIRDHLGNVLEGFTEDSEVDGLVEKYVPLNVSLVLAKNSDGYALIYNRFKKHWEVPGGFIEPGESPEIAASREMQEETGYIAKNINLFGVASIYSRGRNQREYCAVFVSDFDDSYDFTPNSEASELTVWNGTEPFDGYINELDAALIRIGIEINRQ